MANKNNIIPTEYDEQVYNLADFQRAKIAAAVNNAKNRKASLPAPKWWDVNKYGDFQDCIGTATSNYGDESTEIGNQSFLKNHKDKGFDRLDSNSKLQEGDIVQYVSDSGIPVHSVMITGFDENNFPITSYSNGRGVYKTNNTMHHTLDNPGWKANYYRFVGTPAQQAEIEAHNAAVKAKNLEVYGNENGPQVQGRIVPLKVNPLTEIANRRQLMRKL